jgi:predicted ester cyclase
MSLEENKALVQRFIDKVFNEGNTDSIADFTVPGSMLAGGMAGQVGSIKSAFPDSHFTVDEMIAEGNMVVVRLTMQGTNSGPLVGLPAFGRLETPVPPTGKKVMHGAMMRFKLSNGKVVSYSNQMDQIGLLSQLGWTFTPPS